MSEQKNADQVIRELKWLNVKESDPSFLNVRELRGRNVNEELHTPFIRQPPPDLICSHSTVKNLERKGICLPPPINQNTAASFSTILPQSTSDLEQIRVRS